MDSNWKKEVDRINRIKRIIIHAQTRLAEGDYVTFYFLLKTKYKSYKSRKSCLKNTNIKQNPLNKFCLKLWRKPLASNLLKFSAYMTISILNVSPPGICICRRCWSMMCRRLKINRYDSVCLNNKRYWAQINTDEHGLTILFVSPSARETTLQAGDYVSLL